MLILCYGITKSGSTLAFELIKGMLETAGHPQLRLPDGVVRPEQIVNFIEPVDQEGLQRLLAAIGERWIAVKNHSPITDQIFRYLERLQREGLVRITASYRDPRDICLSLLDAAVQARVLGTKEFSEFTDLKIAVRIMKRKLAAFRRWGALKGALRLDYDTVAFSPDRAIDQIERFLGITSDRERAKQYAFNEASTQMNKGKRHRAVEELSPEDYAWLTAAFSEFLERANDDSWYAELRRQIRSGARAQRLQRQLEEKTAGPKRPKRAAAI
ncbi:MAG TPA: sulfotransferase domain-containing protein [Acidobacteriaceae bacterium]|nr:sulfotransferase domain-containing protein [Acidobacteriaceae bacterium]